MQPARHHLRQATQAHHARVDAAFSLFDLADTAAYGRFLSAHARVLLPLEAALAGDATFASMPSAASRLRSQALKDDLDALRLPLPHDPPPTLPADREGVAGICYVLEGSRLGGRVLARRVAAAPGPLPAAFLRHGEDQPLWPTFLAWLESLTWTPAGLARAAAAASATFDGFLTAAQQTRTP
ncbi:biliverdin-producing heme oxygenase [Caenispirillum bisanense]|uniref:biliverdin-producing heme oxygenase n=1 Tax=Caenispirillum bisanense TaxID=414052 RepID=UPI0031D6698F